MPQFTYQAQNANGREVQGTLQAASTARAKQLLQSNGLVVRNLRNNSLTSLLEKRIWGGSVTTKDLILLSRQLSTMIQAGVPILQALQALSRQVDKPRFSQLLDRLAYDIEDGASLSESLSKHPQVFSLFFLGVVRTGEASGRLAHALTTMADYLEQNYVFTRKVRSALLYPVFVLIAVLIVILLMFTYVVPQLVVLFAEANARLPLPTRILIGFNDFVHNYWYVLLMVLVVLGMSARSYFRTPEGQYQLSTLVLRMPGINVLFRKVYLARLTSLLYTLFSSGVPIIESLKLTQASLSNRVYQDILATTIDAVKDGSTISAVWMQQPEIPPMLATMMSVGEKSGDMSRVLAEAHRFFRRDVDEILESVTVFIEPVLVIVLGLGVGVVVAAVLLPIYNLVLVL